VIRHVVMWKFRPGTESSQREFLEGLSALQGTIPELLRAETAFNTGGGNYDAVLIAEFAGPAELEVYKRDPRHQKLSALCRSIREARASVDYTV